VGQRALEGKMGKVAGLFGESFKALFDN
jgi:hypothetical protein